MELPEQVIIVIKLLYMQTVMKIDELKSKLLTTPQQIKAYEALNGKRTIKEIADYAGYSDSRTLETLLPNWEISGLILSMGKGPAKRYFNIHNLVIQ